MNLKIKNRLYFFIYGFTIEKNSVPFHWFDLYLCGLDSSIIASIPLIRLQYATCLAFPRYFLRASARWSMIFLMLCAIARR